MFERVGEHAREESARAAPGLARRLEIAAPGGRENLRDRARIAPQAFAQRKKQALEDNRQRDDGSDEQRPHHRSAFAKDLDHLEENWRALILEARLEADEDAAAWERQHVLEEGLVIARILVRQVRAAQ